MTRLILILAALITMGLGLVDDPPTPGPVPNPTGIGDDPSPGPLPSPNATCDVILCQPGYHCVSYRKGGAGMCVPD